MGGDRLEFGELVMAVATMAVLFALISFPIDAVFVSVLGRGLYEVNVAVSFFLCSLIGGYIYAEKIWEARVKTIAKITVLWAALAMLLVYMDSSVFYMFLEVVMALVLGFMGLYVGTLLRKPKKSSNNQMTIQHN